MEKGEINLVNIRDAVMEIRNSKLPDVKKIGNAGSFFKNPVVDAKVVEGIQNNYANVPVYQAENNLKKLAAGWLIEQAGWKGKREGDAGVHDNQALVLVNHGNASGRQIFQLSEKIKQSVFKKFGVELEREVICI